MSKKVSRRDFARTSVAAGAAAGALPGTLLGKTGAADATSAARKGAAAARARRLVMPPDVSYGGYTPDGREVRLEDALTPAVVLEIEWACRPPTEAAPRTVSPGATAPTWQASSQSQPSSTTESAEN